MSQNGNERERLLYFWDVNEPLICLRTPPPHDADFQPALIPPLCQRNNDSLAFHLTQMPVLHPQTDDLILDTTPSDSRTLSIEFGPEISPVVRSRITYALRVFAAIYGHSVAAGSNPSDGIRFLYSRAANASSSTAIPISARYAATLSAERAPVAVHYCGESVPLFLGVDSATGNPDWLGEIFLWLSGELESNGARRDSVCRIPFAETPFGKYRISPRRPYASLLMAWLENYLCGNVAPALPRALSPIAHSDHLLLPSHDIDYYFCGFGPALVRHAKNLVIAARLYKSSSYFFDNLSALGELFAGKPQGEFLLPLLETARNKGFQSTLFPVVRRAHPRDPAYSLETIAAPLTKALVRGFSLGLHGSYRSVMEDRSLASEAAILGERCRKRPRANRQHWLRFESSRILFREVEMAGMLADSSLGFPESVGFRNGASFAFPPYDFERERPHRFLEVPLVVMDGGLEAEARRSGEAPLEIAEEVVSTSRKFGWGGISILWHNPIEPLSVPREINDVFWRLAKNRMESCEAWLSFDQFLSAALPRYQQAGLMQGVTVNA